MNLLPQYLNWLASAEEVLAETYKDKSLPEIESLLERILWQLTSSFFTGPFIQAEKPLRKPDSAIQYFSFPLFSHFKEISKIEPYWINRYPIFFGPQNKKQLSKVITQYAFLYRWLRANDPHFSLTSFAGNLSWGLSHPPRYILFDLNEGDSTKRARVEITSTNQIFSLVGHMPPAPDISAKLFSIEETVRRILGSHQLYPIIGGDFSADSALSFWNSFDEISDACSELKGAIRDIDNYASLIESAFLNKVKNKIDLRDNSNSIKKKTASGLARFVAWNYVLGFRKIIYCPFRIAERFDNGRTGLVSWGGGILVLSDSVSLSTMLEYVAPRATTDQQSPDNTDDSSLLDLIMGIRHFIDVATPKVILGDWKYYRQTLQSKTIDIIHAQGISEGLGHELKNLQAYVTSYINPVKLDEVKTELEVSLRISKLVWEAYSCRDQRLSLPDLMERLRNILEWNTLTIDDKNVASENPKVSVPYPLLYVLAELCRNAFKYSIGNPVKTPRKVEIDFRIKQNELLSVRVLNRTKRNDPPVTCNNLEKDEGSTTLGLNLVMKIVCNLMDGNFSFKINKGIAIAHVTFNPPLT